MLAGATLSITAGSSLDSTSGTITVDAAVSGGAAAAVLNLDNATIDHGTLIELGALNLANGALIESGSLTNSGALKATAAPSTLLAETGSNSGSIEVLAGATLSITAAPASTAPPAPSRSTPRSAAAPPPPCSTWTMPPSTTAR